VDDALILGGVRTPRGKGSPRGALAGVPPVELVTQLLEALVERGVARDAIDDVVVGCASQLGVQGGNLARMAALAAGLDERTGGAMVNRFCASGLDAIAGAAARVRAGDADLVVAGGVESCSQLALFADAGPWWSHPIGALHMGIAADLAATLDRTSRLTLDRYAATTRAKARAAAAAGSLGAWSVPVRGADGAIALAADELLGFAPTDDDLAALEPAFAAIGAQGQDATVLAYYPQLAVLAHDHTRASSPALADGAALVAIGNLATAERLGLTPHARIVSAVTVAGDPVAMLTAGQDAVVKLLGRAGLRADDVAVFELAEAFAALCVRFQRDLGVGDDRLNPDGGTIALGHAFGATGAILLGNVALQLARRGERWGIAAVSGAAGVGAAVLVEAFA